MDEGKKALPAKKREQLSLNHFLDNFGLYR